MALSPPEIEAALAKHLPDTFQEALLKVTFQSHAIAHRDCLAAFAFAEAENVMGYYRRGKIEQGMRDVTERFGFMTGAVLKADHSGWNHTEVRSGPIVLTENSVPKPCAPIPQADFRTTLAQTNPTLFDVEPIPGDEPDSLYVALIHSRYGWKNRDERQKFGHLPGSAYLVVPDRQLEFYAHEVNLFDKFPKVVRANVPKEWDEPAVLKYFANARKQRSV